MITMLFQRSGNLDIAIWQELREANQAPYVDEELAPDATEEPPAWPHCRRRACNRRLPKEEIEHRPHV